MADSVQKHFDNTRDVGGSLVLDESHILFKLTAEGDIEYIPVVEYIVRGWSIAAEFELLIDRSARTYIDMSGEISTTPLTHTPITVIIDCRGYFQLYDYDRRLRIYVIAPHFNPLYVALKKKLRAYIPIAINHAKPVSYGREFEQQLPNLLLDPAPYDGSKFTSFRGIHRLDVYASWNILLRDIYVNKVLPFIRKTEELFT